MCTRPGDVVLDSYAGSGTTPATAHKLGRRWIAIEKELDTVNDFIRPRLAKVVDGSDQGGISDDVGWTGGGGFTDMSLEATDLKSRDAAQQA